MHRLSALFALALFVASSARAQTPPPESEAPPDEEFVPWTTPPEPSQPATAWDAPPPGAHAEVDASTLPPPVVPAAPPSSGAGSGASGTKALAVVRRPPPHEFNHVSIYGAPTLGQRKLGLGAYLGFPLLGMKVGIGVADHLDAGLGFDSFYGVMNEPRAFVKYQFLDQKNWTMSLQLEAGAAFFMQKPEAEGKGARWLTGRRNYNLEPGVILSYRGDSAQSARLFMDLRYHLAADTEPFTKDPLGGVPPPVVLGHNVPVRLGAEMPFSPSTSFLFAFGFDIHGRVEDAAFMPVISVGLVTGF